MEDIEIVVEFKNLSDTMVKQLFRFTDSRPHEKRYEEGNHVNLRISTENQSPAIILAETKVSTYFGFGIFALCFLVVYMLGTLVVHYHLFSNGNGWRFITLMHPWVFTPFCGMLFFKFIIGVSTGLISSDPKAEEKLILYGRKAEAIVQRADQTGTYINEQPQLKFVLKYADYTGKSHSVTFKKIIPLTQLHTIQAGGTQNILYLPNDPEKIIFAD
ncbi:MAG TPA: hypothetical protein VKY32_06885 [Flavobacterium sp.]|nr:hypothetical protein [Flavobacterium sp.]